MKKVICFLALPALVLWGCYNQNPAAKTPNATDRAQRKHEVQAAVDAGPKTRTWQTLEGVLVELSIPRASIGGRRVEYQRCMVWRDAVTKTSSLHCDRDELDISSFTPDTPDYSDMR